MKTGKIDIKKRILAVMIAFLLFSLPPPARAEGHEGAAVNRFNVVIVLDASNSMNYTDPDGLRYEAIRQFTYMLAEDGNYLGGVVFSNHIIAQRALERMDSQADKEAVADLLASEMSHGVTEESGYTNIGEALDIAVDMLLAADPALPSVILFLSDGNTEMPTEEALATSLEQKADAIQNARDHGVNVYSVCLNANQKADTWEMEQISQATGGSFQEVGSAEDLTGVFDTFYTLIYSTSSIPIADGVFPENGMLETEFVVPGLGVEEVNIIINGVVENTRLLDPGGSPVEAPAITSDTFTLIKLTELTPGTWTLVTEGVPNEHIKIHMIYNTDLGLVVSTAPPAGDVPTGTTVSVCAVLRSGSVSASSDGQYVGYAAEVLVMDSSGAVRQTIPMVVTGGQFQAEVDLGSDGAYFIAVHVSGYSFEKTSPSIGPFRMIDAADPPDANTPPVPVEDPVKKSAYVWPFQEGHITVDLADLARDAEDRDLTFQVLSSSFLEGSDYTLDGTKLALEHFSLSKGSFTIKAIDSGGLSCTFEIIVSSYNLGIMALLGVAAAGLAVAAVLLVLLRIALSKPFRGRISVQSYCNGSYKGTPRTPRRGRCKLSAFGLDPVGLDYQRSYLQATGLPYIYLRTNTPVQWNGRKTNKIRVQSGVEVTVTVSEGRMLYVRFDSHIRRSGRSAAPRGRRR